MTGQMYTVMSMQHAVFDRLFDIDIDGGVIDIRASSRLLVVGESDRSVFEAKS